MRNSGSFMTIFVITLMLLSMKYTTKAQEVNPESGEVDTESGEIDTESGEDDTESGEDDTESGEDDTESGEDDTETGEVDTETGEDNTESRKMEEGRGISFPTYVVEPESEEGSGIPLPTPKENCVQNMNIAFLLDASDSVGPIGFQAIKNHAKRIVKGLHLSSCDNVGLITFSRFANSQTFPGSRDMTADVIARIDALAGPTRHASLEFKNSQVNLGLLLAEHVLFKNQLEIGEPPQKLVVVITDGQQSQPPFTSRDMSVETLAKKLSGKGVRLHVLAIGNSASIPKLLEIAPDERNIFDESSLDNLIAALLIKKDGCERKMDIGFVLDSSESIGPAKFKAIRKYTKKFLHKLDVSKCDHVGLINFNEFANSEIYFRSRETKRDIFKKLDDLESPLRFVQSEVNESRINLALLVADKILFTKQLGLRESSEKVLIVMTDGHQTKTAYNPASSDENFVRKLTNKGVRIFVLAVGNDISIEELLKVTSEERNIFPEKQLDHLIANVLWKKPQLTKDSGKESNVIV